MWKRAADSSWEIFFGSGVTHCDPSAFKTVSVIIFPLLLHGSADICGYCSYGLWHMGSKSLCISILWDKNIWWLRKLNTVQPKQIWKTFIQKQNRKKETAYCKQPYEDHLLKGLTCWHTAISKLHHCWLLLVLMFLLINSKLHIPTKCCST